MCDSQDQNSVTPSNWELLFSGLGSLPSRTYRFQGNTCRRVEGFTPNTQIREHDTKYELVFEVPGFKRTDISVKTDNGVLLVTGEITDTLGGELLRANYDVSEGKFETSWNIPEEIEVEKISAKVTDGILTVWLPKVEKARPKNIEVQ